jgi:hypothetical protein
MVSVVATAIALQKANPVADDDGDLSNSTDR